MNEKKNSFNFTNATPSALEPSFINFNNFKTDSLQTNVLATARNSEKVYQGGSTFLSTNQMFIFVLKLPATPQTILV